MADVGKITVGAFQSPNGTREGRWGPPEPPLLVLAAVRTGCLGSRER